ncbi:Uncharacterised protein [Escherichia coli]|uniref:hypothetical protein n=1 Tax=Escherichia coli TaxID=562 RepID=UPI0006A40951|nr:hypothetical protein [Escherichia coli]CUA04184.1 Uncharacterised protein [Escherichia coli]
MVSKSRLTVNFSSKNILDIISKIANSIPGKSKSRVVEELIAFRLFNYDDSYSTQKYISHAKYMQSKNKQADYLFKDILKYSGFKNGVAFNGGYGDLQGHMDVKIPRRDFYVLGTNDLNYREIKRLVRKQIKDEFNKMSFSNWESNCFSSMVINGANLLMVFIDEIEFSLIITNELEIDKDIEFYVDYKCHNVYGIPFTFGDDQFGKGGYNELLRYLDFNSVCFKTFSDYAKNGWNRSRYSHLIYIDRASKSKRGGFFIGCLYNHNKIFKSYEDRTVDTISQKVSVYLAEGSIIINKIHSQTDDSSPLINKDFARRMAKLQKRHGGDTGVME